jgi:sugar lactone lactonase YvrE
LAFDKAGNLYLSQFYGNWIRWCPPGGGGDYLFAWDSNQPVGLAFDGSGHLYAANSGGNNIEKYTHSGTGSVFINTGLSDPEALAFDSAGSLYVANYGSGTIEKFTPDGVGSVFANVSGPLSLAFDSAGNLYVGTWQNTIEKFTPLGVGSVFATGLGYPGAIAIQVAIKPPAPVFQSVKKTGGTLTLTWSTVAGSRYQLQCSTNSPRGSWYNLGALVLATNTVATYSDSLGSDQPQCFYRVGLLP